MNNAIQTGLAWFGGITALAYIVFGAWLTAITVLENRRLEQRRTALKARRAPITEAEIASVDYDAELAHLTKENGR